VDSLLAIWRAHPELEAEMTVEVQPEDVQTVLAKLLDDPTPRPMELIRAALPEKESNYQGKVLLETRLLYFAISDFSVILSGPIPPPM